MNNILKFLIQIGYGESQTQVTAKRKSEIKSSLMLQFKLITIMLAQRYKTFS